MGLGTSFGLPIGILSVLSILVGSVYGIVVNTSSPDSINQMKSAFTGIFTASTILIVFFTIASLWYVTANPSAFPKYFVIVSSLSLFLSVLSVSYSVLSKTS